MSLLLRGSARGFRKLLLPGTNDDDGGGGGEDLSGGGLEAEAENAGTGAEGGRSPFVPEVFASAATFGPTAAAPALLRRRTVCIDWCLWQAQQARGGTKDRV